MEPTPQQKSSMAAFVASCHFFLSVCFGVLILKYHLESNGMVDENDNGSFEMWSGFNLKVFYFLQPQFWLSNIFQPDIAYLNINDPIYPIKKLVNTISWPMLVSIPFWSVCFGWLVTKISNRLHYHSLKTAQHC